MFNSLARSLSRMIKYSGTRIAMEREDGFKLGKETDSKSLELKYSARFTRFQNLLSTLSLLNFGILSFFFIKMSLLFIEITAGDDANFAFSDSECHKEQPLHFCLA